MSEYHNRVLVGERVVVLKRLRVKERPDQAMQMMLNGEVGFSTPVHVIAELSVDGTPCLWPVNPNPAVQTAGMWFKSMEEWEQDEERFKDLLAKEMNRLKYVYEEQADNVTGFGNNGHAH